MLSSARRGRKAADMISKGSRVTPRGVEHGNAKLTAEQVRAIRSDPRPQRKIAADFGVSHPVIGYIKKGKFWGHVA